MIVIVSAKIHKQVIIVFSFHFLSIAYRYRHSFIHSFIDIYNDNNVHFFLHLYLSSALRLYISTSIDDDILVSNNIYIDTIFMSSTKIFSYKRPFISNIEQLTHKHTLIQEYFWLHQKKTKNFLLRSFFLPSFGNDCCKI